MTIIASTAACVRAGSAPARTDDWQRAVRDAIRDPRQLCRLLHVSEQLADDAVRAADFPMLVPRGFVARMRVGDPDDPLLRQVLPRTAETNQVRGFAPDPVGEGNTACHPGLLRKYRGRLLMVTTGACPVHCRYCFRRHFPYHAVPGPLAAWGTTCGQIAADRSVREVILSGGDPLALTDDRLATLVDQLAAIRHVRRLRIHTRFPIMIPERVTGAMLDWLTGSRLTPIVVLHTNHAAELDAAVAGAAGRLVAAGAIVLNQSVLLAGVNDSLRALATLCERLVALRIVPYYLHQLDRVAGAAHFEVPVARGKRLVRALRRYLPGYAVPRYVREIPGRPSKVVLV